MEIYLNESEELRVKITKSSSEELDTLVISCMNGRATVTLMSPSGLVRNLLDTKTWAVPYRVTEDRKEAVKRFVGILRQDGGGVFLDEKVETPKDLDELIQQWKELEEDQ
jgi:hypothetical protein